MHDLMGRTRYAKYHGWRGRRDFCEAPSQLLEFFCWLPQTLKVMSCHYSYLSEEYKQQWERMNPAAAKQPGKQIPDEMLSALIAAKNVNSAIWTARQVGLSIFDMKVHNPSSHEELESLDIAKEYYTSITEATGLQGPEDEATLGNGYSTTAHFMWGQEANYYSYISYVTSCCITRVPSACMVSPWTQLTFTGPVFSQQTCGIHASAMTP